MIFIDPMARMPDVGRPQFSIQKYQLFMFKVARYH